MPFTRSLLANNCRYSIQGDQLESSDACEAAMRKGVGDGSWQDPQVWWAGVGKQLPRSKDLFRIERAPTYLDVEAHLGAIWRRMRKGNKTVELYVGGVLFG